MASRYVERCSTPLVIREIQTKTTVRYHHTLSRMATLTESRNRSAGENVEKTEPLCTAGGAAATSGNSTKVPQTIKSGTTVTCFWIGI